MKRTFRLPTLIEFVVGSVVLVVIVGAISFVRVLRYGFSVHDEPTALERFMAGQMRHWSIPSDLHNAKNPVPLTPEILPEARAHFADHCAVCHGNDGKGKTEMGEHLYPRAPDMTLPETQSQSDGELFATIENGVRLTGMPGWGDGTAESGRASWTLVHFIRHLPRITPEELAEMESLNPKGPEEREETKQEQEFLAIGDTSSPVTEHHH